MLRRISGVQSASGSVVVVQVAYADCEAQARIYAHHREASCGRLPVRPLPTLCASGSPSSHTSSTSRRQQGACTTVTECVSCCCTTVVLNLSRTPTPLARPHRTWHGAQVSRGHDHASLRNASAHHYRCLMHLVAVPPPLRVARLVSVVAGPMHNSHACTRCSKPRARVVRCERCWF